MQTVRIIPCLDVDGGRVVKGVNFVGLRDAGDPVELARRYDAEGADELVFYDITASADGRATMIDVVRRTADDVFIPLTVGGGVSSVDDARALLRAGADKVSVNSSAVANPRLIVEISSTFGAQCCVLGVDTRRRADGRGHEVFTHGGRRATGLDTITWIVLAERLGAGEVVVNSMDRDGTESGYDLELIEAIARCVSIPIVASGGVGTLDHLVEGARAGANAVLAASIFHYGTFTVAQAKDRLTEAGISVRPVER
jgi:cyclase